MGELKKVSYSHDAIIDEIVANPMVSGAELSAMFGYSQTWLSIMINSDAFKERLAQRKAALTDPMLVASIKDRLDSVAKRSLDKIMARLDSPTAQLKTLELVAIAKLGVGDQNTRPAGPQVSNNLYVVNLPPPAKDSQTWLAGRSNPPGVVDVIENQARG